MEMENKNPTNWRKLSRKGRGRLIAKTSTIKTTKEGWEVPSQSGAGAYVVKFRGESYEPSCSCPDCELRKKRCKHIHAVEFYLKQEIDKEGNLSVTKGVKVTYKQHWKAYDYSQTNEKTFFMRLLCDLSKYVEQPEYKFGRPKLAMQDMIFSSVLKVYTRFSLRRFISDLGIAHERGYVLDKPCYASVGHFMQKTEITPILKNLIKISALPLRTIEDTFAVDSSGFSTCRFARYFDYKHGKESKYRTWMKAHLISGVRTNIVTSAEITEGNSADTKELPKLLQATNENFEIKAVCCDKAYSSRKNLTIIHEANATPFIPFKKNAKSRARGHPLWKKAYYAFLYKHDEFLEGYHVRSNGETVFHMCKTKFGDNLRSKSKTAQVNELLCKILCHNICCVIQEVNELGIRGEFIVEERK